MVREGCSDIRYLYARDGCGVVTIVWTSRQQVTGRIGIW